MFGGPNDLAPNLLPIDTVVQLLIHEADYCDIVTPDKIQAMANLRTGLRVLCRPDDPLDGLVEDNVGDLVTGQKCADQRPSIDCDDQDFL